MHAPRTPLAILVMPLIVGWSIISGAAALAADEQDVDALVESIGTSVVEKQNVVGLSIGVAKGDIVLWAKGFGLANVELNVPAFSDTVYRIGSITKEFTAAAILLLVDDGKVKLDDP